MEERTRRSHAGKLRAARACGGGGGEEEEEESVENTALLSAQCTKVLEVIDFKVQNAQNSWKFQHYSTFKRTMRKNPGFYRKCAMHNNSGKHSI